MKLNILGCHSATPLENAHTTSQVLEVKEHLFLIDCGEGTQIQLRNQKIKFSRIKHIFISHLHGDHFYGLVGLISTFRLLGRKADLHIYGPKGIKEIITLQLKLAAKRSKIKEIILCLDNKKDIDQINQKYLKGLTLRYVKEMKEVLDIAIISKKVPHPKIFKS